MAATTFFGNRASCKLLNTWSAITVTMTTGSTAFSGGSCSAGDYVWVLADGVQHACKVEDSTTLVYDYLGAGGTSVDGYKCTPETLAVLRGLEMNIAWETAELYGTDSILRVDEAKYAIKAEAKIKYCKWDPTVANDWLNLVLRPTGASGVVEDTNTVFSNGTVYTIKGTNGDYMEFVCGRTYWEGVPYPIPENDFIIRDLSGKAASVTAHKF